MCWRRQTTRGYVDPPFCPPIMSFTAIPQWPITTRMTYIFIFIFQPPRGLWLRDSFNPIVTLGSPNLNLGPFRHFRFTQIHLNTLGSLRYTWAPPQAHLDPLGPLGTTLGPLRHTQAHQAPSLVHLDPLGPLDTPKAHQTFFA